MLRYLLFVILCWALFRLSAINPLYGGGAVITLAIIFLVSTNRNITRNTDEYKNMTRDKMFIQKYYQNINSA